MTDAGGGRPKPGRKSVFFSIRHANSADWPSIARLLEEAGLPASDLSSERMADIQIAESAGGELLGGIGIERYGPDALLRPLVIRLDARRLGIGRALIERLEAEAPGRGVLEIWLLTNDAAGFFSRLGYAERARGVAPDSIGQTREFSSLCPASATLMSRTIPA